MSRKNYRNIAIISILLTIIIAFNMLLSRSDTFLHFYENTIFVPLQQARSYFLNIFSFSVGDYLYLLLALLLLFFLVRFIASIITFKKNKKRILPSLYHLSLTALLIYFGFLMLWGGNYARPNIAKEWHENEWDSSSVLTLNKFLVAKLKEETVLAEKEKIVDANQEADNIYKQILGNKFSYLKVKPSALGSALNYLGIQGYYNPLSGEGQFNHNLPTFMHPFIIAHEMAHQTGIAAEDNANLMAYIICTKSNNAAFRYSAYLNVFLYAYAELKDVNNDLAETVFNQLDDYSKKNIAELKELRKQYKSAFRGFSMGLYNQYLVWQGQDKGLRSYDDVAKWVYIWESQEKQKADGIICLQ